MAQFTCYFTLIVLSSDHAAKKNNFERLHFFNVFPENILKCIMKNDQDCQYVEGS